MSIFTRRADARAPLAEKDKAGALTPHDILALVAGGEGNRRMRRIAMRWRPRRMRLNAYGKRRGKYDPWWQDQPTTFHGFKRHG